MFRSTLSLALFTLIPLAAAQSGYVSHGCVAPGFSGGILRAAGAASVAACDSACAGFKYFYYRVGNPTATDRCQCAVDDPYRGNAVIVGSVDSAGTCATDTFSVSHQDEELDWADLQAWMRETTFEFAGCYASYSNPGPRILSLAGSLAIVTDYCKAERTVAFTLDLSSRTYNGRCGGVGTNVPASPQICSDSSVRYYIHNAGAAASQLARRKARLARRKVEVPEYCPSPMVACNVEGVPGAYECVDVNSELELKAVADFLRGKNGPKVRRGVLNGKRVDYFKGKTAARVLTGPAYLKSKKVPEVADEKAAEELLGKVLPNPEQADLSAFFLRVDRPTPSPAPPAGTPKTLVLSPQQHFTPDAYYAWFYDGSPLTTYLGAAAMVLVIFAGVLFPLWPAVLRLGVWYLSILALGAIGALIALAIVRLIFWCITVVATKRAIWMFPNLFEDVGFIDSFIPVWAFDEPKKKKKKPAGASSSGKKRSGGAGQVHIAGGDLMGSQPAQAELKPVEGDAAGASSGVQAGSGSGQPHRRQQATIEEIED